MPYVDPNSVHNPTAGQAIPAAWGDQVRDDLEFFADPPQASVYNSAAQSVSNATTTTMTANSENYDNDTMHSTASNTSRIVAQTAGRFEGFANVEFAADSDGYRRVSFLVNGTTSVGGQTVAAAPTVSTRLSATRTFVLAASDYVEVQVAHTAGGALDVTLDEFRLKWESR